MLSKILIVCLLVIFTCTAYAQKKPFSAKAVEEKLAKITDSLYCSMFETTNEEYKLFMSDIAENHPDIYTKCLVDSAQWNTVMSYGEPMIIHYHSHPGFGKHPLVNISFDAALEYCKWLTVKYNESSKKKFKKVEFVLPSEREWVFAAQGGKANYRYPLGNNSLRRKTGEYLYNFKRFSETFVVSDSLGNPVFNEVEAGQYYSSLYRDMVFYTANVRSFWPNSFNLFNMSGNVAEMINVNGQAMGGSWNSFGGEITTTSKKKYDEPSPEVGFRIFMKIIER